MESSEEAHDLSFRQVRSADDVPVRISNHQRQRLRRRLVGFPGCSSVPVAMPFGVLGRSRSTLADAAPTASGDFVRTS